MKVLINLCTSTIFQAGVINDKPVEDIETSSVAGISCLGVRELYLLVSCHVEILFCVLIRKFSRPVFLVNLAVVFCIYFLVILLFY